MHVGFLSLNFSFYSRNLLSHFFKGDFSSFLFEPSNRFSIEIIICFRILVFLCLDGIVRIYYLQDALPLFFEEEVVGGERTLWLVLGLKLRRKKTGRGGVNEI